MPPSSFFNSTGTDDEDYEEEDEAESKVEDEDAASEVKAPTFIPALDNSCLLDAAEAVLPKAHLLKNC